MTVHANEINIQRGETDMSCYERSPFRSEHHAPPHHPLKPIPPHERRHRVSFTFSDKEHAMIREIFGNDDSAASAVSVISDAPPEVQILAIQAVDLAVHLSELEQMLDMPAYVDQVPFIDSTEEPVYNEDEHRINRVRWPNPVLDDSAIRLFGRIYGEAGYRFCAALDVAPYEIAVVARILAYLNKKAGELNHGHH